MKTLFAVVFLGLSLQAFSAICPQLEGTYAGCSASVAGGRVPQKVIIKKAGAIAYDFTVYLSDEVGGFQDAYKVYIDGVAREYDEIPFLIEEKSVCRKLANNVYEVLTSFKLQDPYDKKLVSSYYQGVARKDKTILFTDYTDKLKSSGSITCIKQ